MTVETISLTKDGNFPNSDLPVIIYRGVISGGSISSSYFKSLFRSNGWDNSWKNGVYDYHHYHSTSHEVLGVYKGWIELKVGGPNGNTTRLEEGDVVVIPAGVAHKQESASEDFGCVGAYPGGKDYDMNLGEKDELQKAVKNIKKVPVPDTDPVSGPAGNLQDVWSEKAEKS